MKSQEVSNVQALQRFECKVLLSILDSRKFSNATFFRQIMLQNLQCKKLGFSETNLEMSLLIWRCLYLFDYWERPKGEKMVSEVCSFGIGTLSLQKKNEKLFWECIFALLNLKKKINIERQHAYCFCHTGDSITNRN